MVKKWMLNVIALLACLWFVYVFLHWTQLRVWARLHQPIVLKFQYTKAESTPSAGSSIRPQNHAAPFAELTTVKLKEYEDKTPKCSPKNLGRITTPTRIEELTEELKARSQALTDGIWQPADCRPEHRFAVLIPYRNRSDNLQLVTHHLSFFLQQQMAQFGIFVIEQADRRLFNRAKLFNVGVKMLRRMYPSITCYVFHDADKLPVNTAHIYSCFRRPRHLINTMRTSRSNKFISGKLYNFFFGGVTSLTRQMFEKVNGMSNNYWGWGREDDDMSARLRLRGLTPEYTRSREAQYINIAHKHDVIVNKNPWPHFPFVRRTMTRDGLNSVNFSIVSITHRRLYTNFKVIL